MAYVCQLTSALVSGISGSAQADAAVMTPLLVPAMEKEGYPRDVAAAVVAGASIKGPIGPISIMFIVYGYIVTGVSISKLLLSGVMAEILLLIFQAGTVYLVVRRMGVLQRRPFAGVRGGGPHGGERPPRPGRPGDHHRRHPGRGVHAHRVGLGGRGGGRVPARCSGTRASARASSRG